MIFLDTNAVILLYTGYDKFPTKVSQLINSNDCYVSPMVRLELQYLKEVGRITQKASTILDTLYKEIGLSVHNHTFDSVVLEAVSMNWTRDPFDRIITAHAKSCNVFLLTTDKTIQKNYKKAIWN